MQAPDDPPLSSCSSHFHLPSPDSDQDPLVTESQHTKPDMVTLPSSPSCIFSPNTATTTTTTTTTTPSAQQLPTPRTPSNDDDDTTTISSTMANNQLTPMIVPAKRGYKSHIPSACKFNFQVTSCTLYSMTLFFYIRCQLSQGSFGVRWYVLYL